MAQNNTDLCLAQMGNTGFEGCGIVPEEIDRFILLPRTVTFTAANLASDSALMEALLTMTSNPKATRAFPFVGVGVIDAVTDNTADATAEVSDYGNHRGVTYGQHMYSVLLANNGLHLFQQFAKYAGNKAVSVILIDKRGQMFMRKNGTGAKGMPCQVYMEQPKMATGAAASIGMLKIALEEEDAFLNDEKQFVFPLAKTTILSDLLHGVHDVRLTQQAIAATSVGITLTLPANFVNLGDYYSTALAAAGAWVVTNKATGAAVVPSGVTYAAATKAFTLAGLTTATTYLVNIAAPAALLALSVPTTASMGAYEGTAIEITTS